MRTIVKKISELTREEYRYCYNANLCSSSASPHRNQTGMMRPDLVFYRQEPEIANEESAKVVMLWDDEQEGAKRLLGWCLTKIERHEPIAYFWVKPSLRNRGYGTMLMQEAKKINNRPKVFPWSREAGWFFSKFDVEVPDYQIKNLVNKPKVC